MLVVVAATWLVAVAGSSARAQNESAPAGIVVPQVTLSAAETAFDALFRGFEQRLTDAGAFTVDVTSRWVARGSGEAQGTNLFHVAVQAGGKLRVEAGSQERGPGQLICVSDGRTITRLLRSATPNLYTQHDAGSTLEELPHDARTMQALNGSGVEFLVRPQFRAQLIAQIAGVEDLGTQQLNSVETRHLQLKLVDKRVFDVWFTTGPQPELYRLVTTTDIPIDDQRTFQLTTTSLFQWRVGVTHPAGTFEVAIPPDARRVNDLLAALQDGDIGQLLGKPAPDLELESLQGTRVNLSAARTRQVVVLICWASWCAPSTDRMASLNEFVALCERGGAALYAVNLGEDRSTVQRTVAETGFTGQVLLDPRAETLAAFRVQTIPVTILIGKDGTVQAYHSGSTDAVRERIRADAAALLAGQTLVPAAR
jgi:hypothetical protein